MSNAYAINQDVLDPLAWPTPSSERLFKWIKKLEARGCARPLVIKKMDDSSGNGVKTGGTGGRGKRETMAAGTGFSEGSKPAKNFVFGMVGMRVVEESDDVKMEESKSERVGVVGGRNSGTVGGRVFGGELYRGGNEKIKAHSVSAGNGRTGSRKENGGGGVASEKPAGLSVGSGRISGAKGTVTRDYSGGSRALSGRSGTKNERSNNAKMMADVIVRKDKSGVVKKEKAGNRKNRRIPTALYSLNLPSSSAKIVTSTPDVCASKTVDKAGWSFADVSRGYKSESDEVDKLPTSSNKINKKTELEDPNVRMPSRPMSDPKPNTFRSPKKVAISSMDYSSSQSISVSNKFGGLERVKAGTDVKNVSIEKEHNDGGEEDGENVDPFVTKMKVRKLRRSSTVARKMVKLGPKKVPRGEVLSSGSEVELAKNKEARKPRKMSTKKSNMRHRKVFETSESEEDVEDMKRVEGKSQLADAEEGQSRAVEDRRGVRSSVGGGGKWQMGETERMRTGEREEASQKWKGIGSVESGGTSVVGIDEKTSHTDDRPQGCQGEDPSLSPDYSDTMESDREQEEDVEDEWKRSGKWQMRETERMRTEEESSLSPDYSSSRESDSRESANSFSDSAWEYNFTAPSVSFSTCSRHIDSYLESEVDELVHELNKETLSLMADQVWEFEEIDLHEEADESGSDDVEETAHFNETADVDSTGKQERAPFTDCKLIPMNVRDRFHLGYDRKLWNALHGESPHSSDEDDGYVPLDNNYPDCLIEELIPDEDYGRMINQIQSHFEKSCGWQYEEIGADVDDLGATVGYVLGGKQVLDTLLDFILFLAEKSVESEEYWIEQEEMKTLLQPIPVGSSPSIPLLESQATGFENCKLIHEHIIRENVSLAVFEDVTTGQQDAVFIEVRDPSTPLHMDVKDGDSSTIIDAVDEFVKSRIGEEGAEEGACPDLEVLNETIRKLIRVKGFIESLIHKCIIMTPETNQMREEEWVRRIQAAELLTEPGECMNSLVMESAKGYEKPKRVFDLENGTRVLFFKNKTIIRKDYAFVIPRSGECVEENGSDSTTTEDVTSSTDGQNEQEQFLDENGYEGCDELNGEMEKTFSSESLSEEDKQKGSPEPDWDD